MKSRTRKKSKTGSRRTSMTTITQDKIGKVIVDVLGTIGAVVFLVFVGGLLTMTMRGC
jgi:hypothetical protein